MGVTEILKSRDPIVELEKLHLQIYPSKTRVEPNDKFTKDIFNLSDKQFTKCITQKSERRIIEKKNHKKVGKIKTPYRVYNSENCHNTEALNMFDLSVLNVCISEWVAGNRYTTLAIIYRGLTGKVNKGTDAKPTPQMREKIMKSLMKLMGTIITPDMTDLCEYLKYNDGTPIKFISAVLPASIIEAVVGGVDVTTIFFDRESPCWTIANIKNQVIRYDAALLDIPNQNNTPMIVGLKNYAIRRIMEIKAHGMTPTLTFDDIFKKLRITNASRKTKMDARNVICDFFEKLKQANEVSHFDCVKKQNKFYSVTFTYVKKSKPKPEPTTESSPPNEAKSSEATLTTKPKAATTTNLFATGNTAIPAEKSSSPVAKKKASNKGRRFGNIRTAIK